MTKPLNAFILAALLILPNTAMSIEVIDKPTKFEAIDLSLEEILLAGYQIISGTLTSSFVLQRQDENGRTYVVCNLDAVEATSACWRLN